MSTRDIPRYKLGEIPGELACSDDKLVLMIDTSSLTAALEWHTEPTPIGEVRFDPGRGEFDYFPAPQDTQPFTVEFFSQTANAPLTQRVQIVPQPRLPSERHYLVSHPTAPEADSTLYVYTTVTTNPDKSLAHLVSGVTLVFEPGHHNQLFEKYNVDCSKTLDDSPDPANTLRTLTLCADRIVIRDTLNLPHTDVKIFARELVFADSEANVGCINTTPLAFTRSKALDAIPPKQAAANGAAGQNGGNVELYAHRLIIPAENQETPRLVLNGGDGQHGGEGLDSKLNDPPMMPGLPGEGGAGGQLTVMQGLQITDSENTPLTQEIVNGILQNRGGLRGQGGGLLGLQLLFTITHDDFFHNASTIGYVSDAVRQAFAKHGMALHDQAFVAVMRTGPWGYALSTTECWNGPKSYTLYDRTTLVDQFKFGEFREDIANGVVTTAFRDWLSMRCEGGEKVRPEHYAELRARFGTLVPGQDAFAMCEDDCRIVPPYLHKLNDRVETRWWVIDPAEQCYWIIESMSGHPDIAHLHLARPFSVVGDLKEESFHVFDGSLQPFYHIHAVPVPYLDRGILHPSLKDEISRRGWASVADAAIVTPLWKTHAWRVNAGDTTFYIDTTWGNPVGGGILSQPISITLALFSQPSARPVLPALYGAQPAINTSTPTNQWLHPRQLAVTLEYARDAYLCEQRAEVATMLTAYQTALALPPPAQDTWNDEELLARYHNHCIEITQIVHRLNSHLDYFGNPAGWAPFLSLQACLRIYQKELDRSLRTLLLAKWLARAETSLTDTKTALEGTVKTMEEETQIAAHTVTAQEKVMVGLQVRLQSLQSELLMLKDKLQRRRDELMQKAKHNVERKSWLDAAFGTFSAICSVIPVGQPALGALGSLSNVVKDMATGEDPLEGVGRITNILSKAGSSWLDDQSKAVLKKAEDDPAVLRKKQTASALQHVSQNMGPALAEINNSLQGLKVPRDEVERELARLAAGETTFQELVQAIEISNKNREALCSDLDTAVQTLTGAYQRITDNAIAANKLEKQRGEVVTTLDHDALRHVRDMEQRAQHTLVKYLYFLLKSYEGTLLEGIEASGHKVDFRLTKVFDKIEELITNQKQLDIHNIPAQIEILRPLFEDNLTEIERSLWERYLWSGKERWANDPAPECRLSQDTPEILRQLNTQGEAVLNLKQLGLLPPGYERARLLHVEVLNDADSRPEFDGAPRDGTVRFVLEALDDGTLRSEGKLYAVRHPIFTLSGWNYHFSDRSLELGERSRSSVALLRELLEKDHSRDSSIDFDKLKIFDYVTPPPAWSNVRIRYDRSDIIAKGRTPPELKSLMLRWHFDVIRANDDHRVLDVRVFGTADIKPLIYCDRADLGDNADGYGDLYRIYPRDATVTVSAPIRYGRVAFSHWQV